jgi:methionyl-tRNA synthetase
MNRVFYITTPIYYVNGLPHIGHSYTTIAADCLARHKRRRGYDVIFLTGTDEHGQKVLKVADENGLTPQAFVDAEAVGYFLDELYKKGDLYLGSYKGLYCVPCEVFWTEKQAVDGQCPDCHRSVEKIVESNYFFKMSAYQAWLLDYIKAHPGFILPDSRRNEVLSFLEENQLGDLCVSRPKTRLSWGIPLPFSPDHVTYVWFDALINYVSALGYPGHRERFDKFWPEAIHLIGKDILRQHAVFWPIMLHAMGLNLPKRIFAHGWWQVGDQKMSKSRGNVVNPLDVIDEFGIDVYRYFLLREVPFGLDGVFSREAIIKRFNGDLANDLGNLVYRTLTMAEKYFDGRVPVLNKEALDPAARQNILPKMDGLAAQVDAALDGQDFIAALEAIWELIAACNKHIEVTKPWNLKKENRTSELENFIAVLAAAIRLVGEEVGPFMPATSQKIHVQIGADRVAKGDPLFPRILEEKDKPAS